jgi:dihydrodipicolinate synthase/N-acetylneuraminate lyase
VDYPQSDAVLYFGALADRSPLPVVVATSAARPLRRERVEALAQHPNIVGVYARGLALGDDLLESVPDGLQVLGGSERSLTDLWAAGVQAAVLPLANAIPFHLLSMDEALRTRETAAAEDLGTRAEEAFAIVWERYGPAGLKHAMDLRGYYGGAPRQPTPPLKPEAKQQIEASLDGITG